MPVSAILFDKDGTLFDFTASWANWTRSVIGVLSDGDAARARALADVLDFDLDTARFAPTSISIAGTLAEQAAALAPILPDQSEEEVRAYLDRAAGRADMVPAAPLGPLMDRLLARGLTLGIATNDAEQAARRHLDRAGIMDRFAFVAGYDSGYDAKPEPGMCLAFARAIGRDPGNIVMVGDSLHDLHAGRAAGMRTVGVLTGTADRATLAPMADAVLASIADLPAWLDTAGQGPNATASVAI